MAAVPELPLGQTVFFRLAKAGGCFPFSILLLRVLGVGGNIQIKRIQARSNLDPQKVFVKVPHTKGHQ